MSWWSCTSTCRSTCSALVRLAYCLHLHECADWVGFHVCAQWHAYYWIPCMWPTTLITIFSLCQMLGWIFNLYGHSFIHECMLRPLLFLCSFMFSLELLLQHMKIILCSILYLCVIFMLCHHLIAWVSKVAFIINGSSCACNFVPPLCFQQPSSRVRCIWYAAFNFPSWCFSLWWCCFHILMSFPMNNLMYSWVGKLIDTWLIASPSVV